MTTDAIITAVDYVNELEEAEKEAQEALPGDPSKCFYELDPINELNHYNDNFKGVYCVCHKAYIENAEDQEMYQCYVCEDWYHEKCIDMPKSLDFENYLCENCIAHHPFLSSYISNSVITMNLQEFIGDCIYQQLKDTSVTKTVENVGNCLSEDTVSTKTNVLKDKISNGTPNHMELLNQLKESTFKAQTSIEAGLEKLQQIDRGKALDGIKHYNNLKDDLKTYLETFSKANAVVTETDILTFFEVFKEDSLTLIEKTKGTS
ncbi:hypothetical protein HDV02_001867 [Globomyces sp. JEL0801]|nr:hypothetical protein HDV02_001867 [Globomyces sp. JEL0801]